MLFLPGLISVHAAGYVSWIGKYADKNAVLVDVLYDCGAVPFVRTNVPQTLMVRIIPTTVIIRA